MLEGHINNTKNINKIKLSREPTEDINGSTEKINLILGVQKTQMHNLAKQAELLITDLDQLPDDYDLFTGQIRDVKQGSTRLAQKIAELLTQPTEEVFKSAAYESANQLKQRFVTIIGSLQSRLVREYPDIMKLQGRTGIENLNSESFSILEAVSIFRNEELLSTTLAESYGD